MVAAVVFQDLVLALKLCPRQTARDAVPDWVSRESWVGPYALQVTIYSSCSWLLKCRCPPVLLPYLCSEARVHYGLCDGMTWPDTGYASID
jgi:hypothetical protein